MQSTTSRAVLELRASIAHVVAVSAILVHTANALDPKPASEDIADMDACMSWSVPAVTKPPRSVQNIAGAPLNHDSLYPDYRRGSHSPVPRSMQYFGVEKRYRTRGCMRNSLHVYMMID